MKMRTLLRFVTVALGLAVILPWAGVASAGGGCHEGVTQGTGGMVEIVDACFTPTTLRIEPGDAVTFVNRDPMIHNVTANGWGHFEDMSLDDRFTVSFEEVGVYPYSCTYHPGMTGAIVVGDGSGPGNGTVVDVALPDPPEAAPAAALATTAETDGSGSTAGWIATIALVLGAGLAAGVAIGRNRKAMRAS